LKLESRALSVAFHYMHYNFRRNYKSLRVTPAMAAGVDSLLWEIGDIVKMIEDWERDNDGA
jgi:hypothetical protein